MDPKDSTSIRGDIPAILRYTYWTRRPQQPLYHMSIRAPRSQYVPHARAARRQRDGAWLVGLLIASLLGFEPHSVEGSPSTVSPSLADSLYTVHHPRILFTREELPALIQKVRDGGYDDDAYAYGRHLLENVYPAYDDEQMLAYSYGVGVFPLLCMLTWLESPPDTTARNLGRRLVEYTADNYRPNANVFYAPLRLRGLALGYDSFYQDAPDSTRAAIRMEIESYIDSMLTTRAYEYWKHRPYLSNISMMIASALGLGAICLDGETDPKRIEAALAMADDYIENWLEYQLDPDGSYKEGAMYAGWCMRHLCYYFWARKRYDGYDYSANSRIRNMENWVAFSLLPNGGAEVNNINDTGSLNYPYSRHHTYFDWMQTESNSGLSAWLWERLVGPEYGHDSGELADPAATMLWNRNLEPVHPRDVLPERFLWKDRGLYYFRSGWQIGESSDDVVFSFFSGKFHGGHSQEDQNNFTLYGYGEKLAIDQGFESPGRDSDAHNMIFIDGKGQHNAGAVFGTDGKIADYFSSDFADYIMGDATAAYNTYSEFNRPGYPFPENDWSGGYDGGNPVEYAHRRFVVVHGDDTPPYFVLMDDVDKDGGLHTYEWRMHTDQANAVDVSANPIRIAGASGRMDIHVVAPEFASLTTGTSVFENGHDDPDGTVISLSAVDTRSNFVFLWLLGNDAVPHPVYATESVTWGEVFTLEWPGGPSPTPSDVFLHNRSAEIIEYAGVTTDAATALIRKNGPRVARYLLLDVTSLEINGNALVTVTDRGLDIALSGSTVNIDRPEADFRIYAPEATSVVCEGESVPFRRDGDYLVSVDIAPTGGRDVAVVTFPNPFNGSVNILVEAKNREHLDVAVYDVAGRLVKSIWSGVVDDRWTPLTWDGTNNNGKPVASGVYIVRVRTPHFSVSKKVVYVK